MSTQESLAAPFARFADFLSAEDHDAVLGWTLANPDRFEPALITDHRSRSDVLDLARRNALISRDFPEIRPLIVEAFERSAGQLVESLGFRGESDFEIELELSAYGDGAHFFPHVDITLGKPAAGETLDHDRRMFSAVYYFHRRPKGFAGGELNLFGFTPAGNEDVSGVAIEPDDNSLVIFPSWVPHQVQPVACRSQRFEDHRFAVNCWLCRRDG